MSDDKSVQDNPAQNDAVEATEQTPEPAADDSAAPTLPADETNGGDATEDGAAADLPAEAGAELEFDEAEVVEPAEPPEPTMEEKLEEAAKTIKATRNKMLRVAADFENFRKRSQREVDDARKRGNHNAVRDLLPVFDNLERATAHVEETPETAAIVQGLKLVHKQFLDVLGKMGIERISALDSPFDPNLHESIQYLHSDQHAAGMVMAEVQPGYRMDTTLLRPAMVVVSRGPEPSESEAPPAADSEDAEPHHAPDSDAEGAEAEPAGKADAEGADAEGVEPTASAPAEAAPGASEADAAEAEPGSES